MTKKDFFIILVKLFGLYLIINVLFLSSIPNSLVYIFNDFNYIIFLGTVASLGLIFTILLLLLYKTDKIVLLLKLDKGFDDDRIDFGNIKIDAIVKLVVLVLSGLIIIDNIVPFLTYTLFAFKSAAPKAFDAPPDLFSFNRFHDYFDWAVTGISLLVGYLIFTNFRSISRFLLRNIERE